MSKFIDVTTRLLTVENQRYKHGLREKKPYGTGLELGISI